MYGLPVVLVGIGVVNMSKTDQVEQNGVENGSAFDVLEVNTATNTVLVAIHKGIIGPMANQLKTTSDRRKGHRIIRALGHQLAGCGDVLYGKPVEQTNVDPECLTDEVDEL